jgi:methyl-accepting chemotaxis protein/methyl-accepting chemotaxis protein-1 (serine sensor receptor)
VQTRGIEEVAKAVVQIQQVTQSTAACAEESAAAAEELSAQSETLKAVVLRLTTLVGGDKTLTTRQAYSQAGGRLDWPIIWLPSAPNPDRWEESACPFQP